VEFREWGLPWPGEEVAHEAEVAGASAFCSGEFADRDAYVGACEMASATRSARVGTAVAYAFTRAPWAHAAAVRQLARRAPGRIFLGLGAGTRRMNRDWFSVPFDPVLARMEELVGAIRAFLLADDGERVRFAGRFYAVDAHIRAPVMGALDVPILLGAFHRGMLAVAGRCADGVVGHGLFTDRYWCECVDARLDAAARSCGRDPASLLRWGWLITAIDDEDPERARRDARRMIAFYLTVKSYDALAQLHGWEREVGAIRECFANGDVDAMAAAVPDDMLEAIAICGTQREAAAMLASRRHLPTLVFASPPGFLVSERRRRAYARGAVALLGKT